MNKPARYQLYGFPYTSSVLTEMVLCDCGLDYDTHEVNIFDSQHKTKHYAEINPTGLIPTLITPQGNPFYEAPAINLYLADLYPQSGLAPITSDPQRGEFLSGLFFLTSEFEPTIKRYFYPHRYCSRPRKHRLR